MSNQLSPLADVPPVGGWVRSASNPVITSAFGLPENIVFDPVSNKYYSPISMMSGDVGLISSTDLTTWTMENTLLLSSNGGSASPHLLFFGGTWHLYYGKLLAGATCIYVATSSAAAGPYTDIGGGPLLSPTGSGWEKDRVLEPFVFQEVAPPFRWIMLYMGDANKAFPTESCGYATATTPLGPFTRYAANPVLPIGPPGAFDHGGTADPFVYWFDGLYYIFYACTPELPTTVLQFNLGYTGYYTSPDLITFTKCGIAFRPSGVPGAPDEIGAVRGGIIRKDDTYYFIYAGRHMPPADNYTICLATLPAKAPKYLISG